MSARRVASESRPQTLNTSKSFNRMDTVSTIPSPRRRATTLQEAGIPAVPEARRIDEVSDDGASRQQVDVFESLEDAEENSSSTAAAANPDIQLPSEFDELPIEIKSLTERFLESLSAKVHPTALTADTLSDLFQDFYEKASSHIATHIATLASRIGRGKSTGAATKPGKGRSRAGSGAGHGETLPSSAGGEMLTPSEVSERRKARRLLELRRLALEEAVERAVCEKVYGRVWKHRSTDDDARDEKLRSKTAALAVVGIGLKELHMDSDPAKENVRKTAEEKEDEIHHSLAAAREALQHMDDEHYPLGKLQHLKTAHKSIVDTLSQMFPSSSSADEILPTLIYTLITSPPEGINVVSNLNFIQRFRASSKVDGEAAYCLVNLEAAISFLETVDLSSLRADELPEGPSRSLTSGPSTPTMDKSFKLGQPEPARPLKPTPSPMTVTSSDTSTSPESAAQALPLPKTPTNGSRPQMHQRRISHLVQQQADKIEAGRENLLSAADKIYDSINGTLENSLQFVFGRFKDQQVTGDSPLPKTLEDARKLVSSTTVAEEEEALVSSGRSSPAMDDPLNSGGKGDNKMLELIGGRKQLRDRSVDSTRSGGSGKRVVFANENMPKEKPKDEPAAPVGNLFAQINPLNRFGVPGFARFGRSTSLTGTTGQPSPTVEKPNRLGDIVESPAGARHVDDLPSLEKQRSRDVAATADDDLNAREALAELRKIKPPKKRFLDVQSAGELRLSEVEELLMEYRRLAKAIGEAIAS